MNDSIEFLHPDYVANLAKWQLIKNVCNHDNLDQYIPELCPMDKSRENKERNKAYKERAVFLNATGKTKDGLIGLSFKKDPQFVASDRVSYLENDADGAGVSIFQQSQTALSKVLQNGCGLYSDYNEDTKQSVILLYDRVNITNWRVERINGRDVLSLVVLKEYSPKETRFSLEFDVFYRELRLEDGRFVCRKWGKSEGGSFEVVAEYTPVNCKQKRFDYIPFVFIGSESNSPDITKSPLYDMAILNIAHLRNSADYEESVHLCGQIQPFITNLDENWRDHLEKHGVHFGSGSVMLLPQDSVLGVAQGQPNSMVKEAMDKKESQMILMGARLIEKSETAKTATQAVSDETAATSVLSICCSNLSEAYTQAIKYCQNYFGIDSDASYTVNQDFTVWNLDASMITTISNLNENSKLPDSDMYQYLRRIGLIKPDKTDEQIKAEIESSDKGMRYG